jgi:hypothetical protein
MNSFRSFRRAGIVAAGLAVGIVALESGRNVRGEDPPKKPASAWELDEALQQLAFHPKDPYLQYVALQLGKREGRSDEVLRAIEGRGAFLDDRGRGSRADLFSTFTGALAIQESLQLDTMRGGPRPARNRGQPAAPRTTVEPVPPPPDLKPPAKPTTIEPPGEPAAQPNAPVKKPPTKVAVSSLVGPTVQSHPWEKMLAGKRPDVGVFANCVPEEFWLAEFRSLAKLNEVMGLGQLLGGHIFAQAMGDAKSPETAERIKKQLGLMNLPPKVLESLEIEGIAATGSDLFLGEGSDLTFLIQSKKLPNMLRLLESVQVARGKKEAGQFLGMTYTHQSTPDGSVNNYSANPRPDLHVRSNSLPALQRVLEAVSGKTASGKPARRLGDSLEFHYIRTLMPLGAAEEDGLVYLSDPFIRRLVGPQLKLTEQRRVQVYNHLRMIGHACLMFRSEFGRAPKSLEELAETQCAPGVFGKGDLAHPDGGTYSLSADGMSGVCSKYGRAEMLSPCLEHLVTEVSSDEADDYKDFVTDYNEYWRTYFDPIAIRVQASAKQYRLETLVLPLIDNSVYTTMAQIWGGKPAALDALPTPKREIGGLWVHVDKKPFIDALGLEVAKKIDREQKRQGAKSINGASNDLKLIGLSLHNYHDVNRSLPPAPHVDMNGKPLLSWRVAILPYLEQDNLYREFRMNEPWDSEHNKKLIAKMPAMYRGPNKKLNDEFKTIYLAPIGKNTMFPPDGKKITFTDVADGLSNTIMAVEANDDSAVIWTKPDDLPMDLAKPLRGLERPGQDYFLALMGDGSVQRIKYNLDVASIAALFTRDGGEVVNLQATNRKAPVQPKTDGELADDMKQLLLALHNYQDTHLQMPPAASRDKDGKPLLSWRVAILPFIEQDNLYRLMKHDEPWDSEHNKQFIARMPRIFQGLNKKLNDEFKTAFLAPVGKETMFPPDGAKIGLGQILDGTSNTIAFLQANDDSAAIWTKPDDLTIDLKDPLKGLAQPGRESFLVGMGDGSVRKLRLRIDAKKFTALLTRAGGEIVEVKPEDEVAVPVARRDVLPFNWKPSEEDLQRLESLGLDLNKLRRFLRVGVGDQIGLHMHDGQKMLDFDIANALSGRGDAIGMRMGGPTMFGLGLLVQFATGPSSISIPVNDPLAVDEFLNELDRWTLQMKAEGEREFGRMIGDMVETYRMQFPKPHNIRCVVIKAYGLKLRLFWGRIGNGLYIANRPFILEDIAAAQAAEKKTMKPSETAHALVRVRPENWNEVLPGYNLSWAENHRNACHENLSLIANVNRGWNDRTPKNGGPDAELLGRVARFYGTRPFCPDGGKYALSLDGKSCSCSVHGDPLNPKQPSTPGDNSPTGKLFRSFAGLNATLTFEPEGLRAVMTIERK